jgi:hypothetical protein
VAKKPTKKKRSKKAAEDTRSDDEVMFWFGNHLMSYFGDDGYDDKIIARLRELFPHYPLVEQNFRRGIDIALGFSDKDSIRLVEHFANRQARTADQARAWLSNLRDKLFAP